MVVVRSEEEFWSFLKSGYTPYLMKSQNRWYLRRGQRRHIIARELEELASRIAAKLMAEGGEPVRAGVVQKMRESGALVEDVAEDTDLSRGAVYGAFERRPEELVKPRVKTVPKVFSECTEERKIMQKANHLLEDVRLLGKLRREKKGCFNAEESICARGISSEVGGIEFVRHEHSAPIPLLPPAIDYHFKPDLEFCAFCPLYYEHGYDADIIEVCLQVSNELKALSKALSLKPI